MSPEKSFELTYGSMFNPPEELHTRFDDAVEKINSELGKEHAMFINGNDRFTEEKFVNRSPVDSDIVLGVFQKGTAEEAKEAIDAARDAFPPWSRRDWRDRISLLRKAADLIDERTIEFSALLALEVGKSRMEALADIAEAAALMRYACDQIEENNGFVVEMGKDPIPGFTFRNTSILRPYGVWLVISPFNFPGVLSYSPVGAALAAGNTVVLKPATDTPLIPCLLGECLRDAGIPDGVFNYVTGPGSTLGQALVDDPHVAGITFTGSYDVGMGIYRSFANGRWVRPIILELGGKNPVIVSRNADIEDAAMGITRSAFGLQGQKCSANSRVFVEAPVYEQLIQKLAVLAEGLVVGDPRARETFMGPVINEKSYSDYQKFVKELAQSGEILTGGKILTDGDLGKGYFCAPTLVADLPLEHHLWKYEMFLPITTISKIKNLEQGMNIANDIQYGLTAGFYGAPDEVEWYFDHIEAGVVYANRPQGSTTGAWPGYQPFGGWKGSGASGKSSGGIYYVQLYMHEQSRTVVNKS